MITLDLHAFLQKLSLCDGSPDAEKGRSSQNPLIIGLIDLGRLQSGTHDGNEYRLLRQSSGA